MQQVKIDNVLVNYDVDEEGNIYNHKTGHKVAINDGRVQLSIKGKPKRTTVGRIVAETFLVNPNPEIYTLVGHKDGNCSNNKIENLYWMSTKENSDNTWDKRRQNNTTGAGQKREKRENIVETGKIEYVLEKDEKQIKFDNEKIPYAIRKDGRVRNLKNNYILKGTILHTYQYINFRWNGKQKNKAVHQLVATAFIENPNNYSMVDHIDGNRLNNNLKNLRWVSAQENAQNKHETIPKQDKQPLQEDLPNEIWKEYKDTEYQVSNLGRVKGLKGRVLKGHIADCGYREYSLRDGKVLGHRLVWETFEGAIPEKMVINHKDGNKLNNKLENLEMITSRENSIKAAKETNAWGFSRVGEFNENLELLRVFLNATDAANAIGILPGSMRNSIRRKGKCFNGFYYQYLDK